MGLTTGIYNSWIAFDDLAFANQLSFYLLLFIFALFILENLSRKKARYHMNSRGGFKQKQKIKLSGGKSLMAFMFCFLIFFLSFLCPLRQMLYWTIKFPQNLFDLEIIDLLINTLYLVVLSSFVLIIFALISNYGNRVTKNKTLNILSILSISGCAIPGVILAVAFITFIAWFDESVVKTYGFLSIKKVFILISLEIIRELPITLILRPFNFETFATTAYISASEDLLEAAAVPSLFLILIATIFIMFTSKYILREK